MSYEKNLALFQNRVENVKWFQPSKDLTAEKIEEKVKFVMKCFGIEASVEIRTLKTVEDWDAARHAALGAAWGAALGAAWDAARGAARHAARHAARDAAWHAARDAAWGAALVAAWDATRDAAWDAARGAAWGAARRPARDAARDAAWDAARGAAWGATETVAQDLEGFKSKYPNGALVPLFELWEMGLYPIGATSGKFVIYLPQ